MTTISNRFKIQDKGKCLEDIYSSVYNITFFENHDFYIVDINEHGLILEDEEGYLLKNISFDIFEVTHERGNYIDNNNSGWYSNRRNHNHPNHRY